MALNREEEAAGGPALRKGPLQKIEVSANNLASRFQSLLNPPPR